MLAQNDLLHIMKNTKTIFQSLNEKKVLITGGTGFFGKWLLESFAFAIKEFSLDTHVYILSRNPENFISRYPHLGTNTSFSFLAGDIKEFFSSLPKIDFIIHAATSASAKLNYEHPLVMIDSIVSGTRNILEFTRINKIKRMLFVSSGAVYGVQPETILGFREDYTGGPNPLDPSSAYAEAKRMAEQLCICYANLFQIEIPIARCFTFVGPYLDLNAHFAIGNFLRNCLNGNNIIIKGTGSPMRSYMYTSDLVIWLLHILVFGQSREAYNVGSDEAVSIKELAYKVASRHKGLQVEIMNQIAPTDRNQNYVPDITKTKNAFNFDIPIRLDDSIEKTLDFYQRTKW